MSLWKPIQLEVLQRISCVRWTVLIYLKLIKSDLKKKKKNQGNLSSSPIEIYLQCIMLKYEWRRVTCMQSLLLAQVAGSEEKAVSDFLKYLKQEDKNTREYNSLNNIVIYKTIVIYRTIAIYRIFFKYFI